MDELKAINDQAGHDAGDRALRRVAGALVAAAAMRPGNVVGRLSGDEFCVVLDGGDAGRRPRRSPPPRCPPSRATRTSLQVSCGAAAFGPAVSTPALLLRAADAAQYRAKRNGGGQIFTAGRRTADPPVTGERRTLRRRSTRDRLRDSVQELAERFAGDLAGEGALDRLEAVAASLSEALNAAAWAISFTPAGGDTIRTASAADGRDQRLQGLRLEAGQRGLRRRRLSGHRAS